MDSLSGRPMKMPVPREDAMTSMYGVRREEWVAYEKLRRSGICNMYESRGILGLEREQFRAIMEHYEEMRDAWDSQIEQ